MEKKPFLKKYLMKALPLKEMKKEALTLLKPALRHHHITQVIEALESNVHSGVLTQEEAKNIAVVTYERLMTHAANKHPEVWDKILGKRLPAYSKIEGLFGEDPFPLLFAAGGKFGNGRVYVKLSSTKGNCEIEVKQLKTETQAED